MTRSAPIPIPSDGRRWLDCVVDPGVERATAPLVGVLPGEGVGPAVVGASVEVLRRLTDAGGASVELETGGEIGFDSERASGETLTDEVVDFCAGILGRGGAILNGPGGGRYVYDLRRRLGLFLKISPIQAWKGLAEASPLRTECVDGVDLLVVRENLGGVYHGDTDVEGTRGDRRMRHSFDYVEEDVRCFLAAAARLAGSRRGELTVVTKEAGVPAVSRLWRECAAEVAEKHSIGLALVDTDLIAYRLVQAPREFDVIAAPNLYGDVLSDLGAVLVGSRGLTFSGNFTREGGGVYQTNHGAAYDIAGSDRANPLGQILSTAMLLRESLGLHREAFAIEEGTRSVWRQGWRTADLGRGDRVVGTAEMASLVADAAAEQLAAQMDAA